MIFYPNEPDESVVNETLAFNKKRKLNPPIPLAKPAIEPRLREPLPVLDTPKVEVGYKALERPVVTSVTDNVQPTVQAGRDEYVKRRLQRPGWKQALINAGLGALKGIGSGGGLGGALGGAVGGALGGGLLGRERALEGEYNMLQRPRDLEAIQAQQNEIAQRQAAEDRVRAIKASDADIAYKHAQTTKLNRPELHNVNGTLVGDSGNIVYQGEPDPKRNIIPVGPEQTLYDIAKREDIFTAPSRPEKPFTASDAATIAKLYADAGIDVTAMDAELKQVPEQVKSLYPQLVAALQSDDEQIRLNAQKQLTDLSNSMTQNIIDKYGRTAKAGGANAGIGVLQRQQRPQSNPTRTVVPKDAVEKYANKNRISYEEAEKRFTAKGIKIR